MFLKKKKSNSLFRNIKPYLTDFLEVGKHKIYYEECGNPNGKPAVFLHGGPGGGGSTRAVSYTHLTLPTICSV